MIVKVYTNTANKILRWSEIGSFCIEYAMFSQLGTDMGIGSEILDRVMAKRFLQYVFLMSWFSQFIRDVSTMHDYWPKLLLTQCLLVQEDSVAICVRCAPEKRTKFDHQYLNLNTILHYEVFDFVSIWLLGLNCHQLSNGQFRLRLIKTIYWKWMIDCICLNKFI